MITLPYSGELLEYAAKLKARIILQLNGDQTRFCALFLDENFPAKDVAHLANLLAAEQIPRTFIVDGGPNALARYLKQHALSLKNQPTGELPVFQCRALR